MADRYSFIRGRNSRMVFRESTGVREDGAAQPPGICVTDMVYPALNGQVDGFQGEHAASMCLPRFSKFPLERKPFLPFQQAMIRINEESEKWNPFRDWAGLAFGFVQGQAQFGELGDDSFTPKGKCSFVVREQ